MARKTKKPSFVNFQHTSLQLQILEAGNVVRWNPKLAIEWMHEAELRVTTQVMAKLWNKTAKQMNKTMDMIEKCPSYNKTTYWGEFSIPSRLEFIEENLIDLEQYLMSKV